MPGNLEIQKAEWGLRLNAVIWMLIKKHWHAPYHPGRQLLLSCHYRDGRFILGEIKEKSYKIRNSGYNWDQAKSWMENTGVMWKCAHCIVNLQLPSYVQVLEVWQPGVFATLTPTVWAWNLPWPQRGKKMYRCNHLGIISVNPILICLVMLQCIPPDSKSYQCSKDC